MKMEPLAVTGTKDWTRVTVSISEAEAKVIAPAAAKLRIAIGVVSQTSGTMYFDAVRMFEGNIDTKYAYDDKGNYITSITNQLKNTTSYTNDNRGNVLQKPVQGGATTTYVYNNANELTHRNGAAVYSYDYNGNLTGSSPWVMTY